MDAPNQGKPFGFYVNINEVASLNTTQLLGETDFCKVMLLVNPALKLKYIAIYPPQYTSVVPPEAA